MSDFKKVFIELGINLAIALVLIIATPLFVYLGLITFSFASWCFSFFVDVSTTELSFLQVCIYKIVVDIALTVLVTLVGLIVSFLERFLDLKSITSFSTVVINSTTSVVYGVCFTAYFSLFLLVLSSGINNTNLEGASSFIVYILIGFIIMFWIVPVHLYIIWNRNKLFGKYLDKLPKVKFELN